MTAPPPDDDEIRDADGWPEDALSPRARRLLFWAGIIVGPLLAVLVFWLAR